MRAFVFLFLSAFAVSGADLTGQWVAQMPPPPGGGAPGGGRPQMMISVIQKGDRIAAFQRGRQGDDAFSGVRLSGDDVTFVMNREFGTQKRTIEMKGKVQGDEMRLLIPSFRPGGEPREVVYKRVSREPLKMIVYDPPSLPAVHDLTPNGLAMSPPMGWNSWNKFHCEVTDKLIRETADTIVATGMAKAGYVYVNIDDCWQGERDAKGVLQPNSKFPNMKALADYVHSKGLKIGIYSSPGPKTCAGYEGSYNHEQIDAKTWAAWGIDYLKYDWCSAPRVYKPEQMRAAYQKMAEALRATGRPIVYSLCQYGLQDVWAWGPKVGGNLWRTTGDISASWKSMSDIGFDRQAKLYPYAAPGHWNDPDMLEVGNPGLSDVESRTHMSLWVLLAAPLLAGNDLTTMTEATRGTLMNPEVIAVNQDKLGKQAQRVSQNGASEIWTKELSGGAKAVGLFNRGETPARIVFKWSDVGVNGAPAVRDLWNRAAVSTPGASYEAEVPAHGVVLLKVTPGPVRSSR